MVKLDLFDQKILYELDKSAKIRLSTLSKKLKRSKQFIDYRIKKLEQAGIIKGYKAVVDMSKFGFSTFRIYLKFQNISKEMENKFIQFLIRQEEVWCVGRMYGKYDLAFFIGIRNALEFQDVFSRIELKFKKYMKYYNLSYYSPIYFFSRRFYLSFKSEVNTIVYGNSEKLRDIEKKELKLLKKYSDNVRKPIINIANELKLSPTYVRNKIKDFERKKIICGYKLDMNYEKLGYTAYRVDFHLIKTDIKKELFEFCKNIKNVYCINYVIGGGDFEVALCVKDFYEFRLIIDQIINKFGDIICDDEYIGFSTFSTIRFIPD